MLQAMIPLINSFLPLWHEYLIPVFCLCFVAWVGAFLHVLFRR